MHWIWNNREWLFSGIGVTILMGAYYTIRRLTKQALDAKNKRQSSEIEIKILETKAYPIDTTNEESKFHVFVRAQVELRQPHTVDSVGYRLQLIFHGVPHSPKEHCDIREWIYIVRIKQPDGIRIEQYPMIPLERSLTAGLPVEGWLHFVTDHMLEPQLHQSMVRLFVQSAHGTNYGERLGNHAYWIDLPMNVIVHKSELRRLA